MIFTTQRFSHPWYWPLAATAHSWICADLEHRPNFNPNNPSWVHAFVTSSNALPSSPVTSHAITTGTYPLHVPSSLLSQVDTFLFTLYRAILPTGHYSLQQGYNSSYCAMLIVVSVYRNVCEISFLPCAFAAIFMIKLSNTFVFRVP